MNHPQSDQAEANAQRAAWMRVLALAESSELDGAFGALGSLPAHRMLRPAQSGMAMVRARSGGTGTRFNLGEMTLTLRGHPGERRGRHRLCARPLAASRRAGRRGRRAAAVV